MSSLEWVKSELENSAHGRITNDLIVADTAWPQMKMVV